MNIINIITNEGIIAHKIIKRVLLLIVYGLLLSWVIRLIPMTFMIGIPPKEELLLNRLD
jgi:hypothetical protein